MHVISNQKSNAGKLIIVSVKRPENQSNICRRYVLSAEILLQTFQWDLQELQEHKTCHQISIH